MHNQLTQTLEYLAANVARLRARQGLSQEGLANAATMTLRHLQRIEAATANISLDLLVRLATALEVKAADLLAPAHMGERKRGRPTESIPPRRKKSISRAR